MKQRHRRLETKVIPAASPNAHPGGGRDGRFFQSAMFEYAGETDYTT